MIKSIVLILIYAITILFLIASAIVLNPPTCSTGLGWCEVEKIPGHLWVSSNEDEGFHSWNLLLDGTSITVQLDYNVVP